MSTCTSICDTIAVHLHFLKNSVRRGNKINKNLVYEKQCLFWVWVYKYKKKVLSVGLYEEKPIKSPQNNLKEDEAVGISKSLPVSVTKCPV